jgi:hypothetical protein
MSMTDASAIVSVQAKIVGSIGSIGNADVPHAGECVMMHVMQYEKLIQIRTPEAFAKALDRAAAGRLMSRSDYIRTTLLEQTIEDGIDLDCTTNSASSDDQ